MSFCYFDIYECQDKHPILAGIVLGYSIHENPKIKYILSWEIQFWKTNAFDNNKSQEF